MIKEASLISLFFFVSPNLSANNEINPKILIDKGTISVNKREDSPLFYDGFYTKGKMEVKPFYIQKYEVTYKEFFTFAKEYVKSLPKESKIEGLSQDDWLYQYEKEKDEEKKPVSLVTFFFAVKYCTNIGGRLPTEREWILAAYPFKKDPDPAFVSNYITNVDETFEGINGVNGMVGSLWEMTSDDYPIYHSENRDPEKIIIKGGSFLNSETPLFFDSRLRNFIFKNQHGASHVGFRCAFEREQ